MPYVNKQLVIFHSIQIVAVITLAKFVKEPTSKEKFAVGSTNTDQEDESWES